MVWLVTAAYSFLLIPWYFLKIYQLSKQENTQKFSFKLFLKVKLIFGIDERRLSLIILIVSPIWFISGYSWYLSLAHTSVTANTIIANSSFIWTLILSIFLLQEKISSLKIACCFFCFCGLIIVTFAGDNSDEDGVDQTKLGFFLACLSTVLNSAYDVFYKRFAPSKKNKAIENESEEKLMNNQSINGVEENEILEHENSSEKEEIEVSKKDDVALVDKEVPLIDALLFLGLTGFFMAIFFWPGIPILNWLGIEEFEVPTKSISLLLFFNVVLEMATTLGIFATISWTSPMFTDITLLITIPTAVVFDVIIHGYILPLYGWIGVVMIVLGFLCIILADILIDYRLKAKEQGKEFSNWLDKILCFTSAFYAFNWKKNK